MNNIISVFLFLASITLIGSLLRSTLPVASVDRVRKYITILVLYIFWPIIIFRAIYTSSWNEELFKVPLVIGSAIILCLVLSIICLRWFDRFFEYKINFCDSGALLLASTFGSVVYFGLPVLHVVFPGFEDTGKIVVLAGLVTTPSCLFIANLFSSLYKRTNVSFSAIVKSILQLPYFWAISGALLCNTLHLPISSLIINLPDSLNFIASVLMMLSLGMSLRYRFTHLPILIVSASIKLIFSPLIAFGLAHLWHLKSPYLEATTLEAAMPTLVLSIIAAEKFNFNRLLLAQCIYFDTLVSFFTIPLVYLSLFGKYSISFLPF